MNEYDYIEVLQESTPQELEEMGISMEEATAVVNAFEDALFERATLSDSELRAYGYNDSEIKLLHSFANGQTLSCAELQALSSTCEGELTRVSCNDKTATFSYTWEWDRCPIITLTDAAAMKWIVYDNNNNDIGVQRTSKSMNIEYYLQDKNTGSSSTRPICFDVGTEEPDLDFNSINMQFPVWRTFTSSNGIISDCYAKKGTVEVSVRIPSGTNKTIHDISVAGLYGHTLVGVGAPCLSVGGKTVSIGFTGNTSIDPLASKKGTIYRSKPGVEYWE